MEFWLINDYQNTFSDCVINFIIERKIIGKISIDKISEDSIKHFNAEKIHIFIPKNLKEGKHLVEIELKQRNKKDILSYNDFEIEIVRKV